MTTKAASRRPAEPHLDNLTLSRKEGWKACTEAPKRIAPELLTKSQIRRLSEAAADIYKQAQKLMQDDSPDIFLFYAQTNILQKPWVKNLQMTAMDHKVLGDRFLEAVKIAKH